MRNQMMEMSKESSSTCIATDRMLNWMRKRPKMKSSAMPGSFITPSSSLRWLKSIKQLRRDTGITGPSTKQLPEQRWLKVSKYTQRTVTSMTGAFSSKRTTTKTNGTKLAKQLTWTSSITMTAWMDTASLEISSNGSFASNPLASNNVKVRLRTPSQHTLMSKSFQPVRSWKAPDSSW